MPLAKGSPLDAIRRVLRGEVTPPTPEQILEQPLSSLHVAVQGCCHGELDKIYAACREHEATTGRRIDLLLCCGDFQSVRNTDDMASMAIPDKYKIMGDFPSYYRGEKVAPVLTLFIGGNHEASNVLATEYYGGRLAPNIYYVGHSAVVQVAGLRIAGLSGIYHRGDTLRNYPLPPYNSQTLRSAYHVREFEVHKLHAYADLVSSLQTEDGLERNLVDVVLSHDWPVGITRYGNEAQLLAYKPYFADDVRHGQLGNPMTMPLLRRLRPKWWFSAHLHCHFTATVEHREERSAAAGPMAGSFVAFGDVVAENEDDMVDGRECVATTRFLALDKCTKKSSGGPRKSENFIEFIDMPVHPSRRQVPRRCPKTKALLPSYDRHWVAVMHASHPYIPWETTLPRIGAQLSQLVKQASVPSESVEMTNTATVAATLQLLPWPPPAAMPSPHSVEQTTVSVPNALANADANALGSEGDDDIAWAECV